jgi:Xaa-Pro dipeptidase
MHPYFSKSEFDRRHRLAREFMRKIGLDAVVVTGEENYTYFTGATSLIPWRSFTRPVFCLLPLENEPVILVSKALEDATKQVSSVSDIRVHTAPIGLPGEVVAVLIKDKGLENAKIGFELGYEQRLGLPYNDFFKTIEALPHVVFEDASALLWKLRMKKSPAEISLIQRACEITAKARQKCFQEIRPGMTEREVGQLFRKSMIEFGADDIAFAMVNSLLPFQMEKPLVKGGLLYVDGGARVGGYCCDYARIGTLGRSTPAQLSSYRTLLDVSVKMAEALRPGVKCSQIFQVYQETLCDARMAVSAIGRAGHGQGMLVTEPPSISATDDTALEPGFVISTEPSIASSEGEYIIEDVHVITENGKVTLTTEPKELREFSFL